MPKIRGDSIMPHPLRARAADHGFHTKIFLKSLNQEKDFSARDEIPTFS